MNDFETRLLENTAQLVRIEKVVSRLIDRLDTIYQTKEDESDELNLNPYAILCQIAKDSKKSSHLLPVYPDVHH